MFKISYLSQNEDVKHSVAPFSKYDSQERLSSSTWKQKYLNHPPMYFIGRSIPSISIMFGNDPQEFMFSIVQFSLNIGFFQSCKFWFFHVWLCAVNEECCSVHWARHLMHRRPSWAGTVEESELPLRRIPFYRRESGCQTMGCGA